MLVLFSNPKITHKHVSVFYINLVKVAVIKISVVTINHMTMCKVKWVVHCELFTVNFHPDFKLFVVHCFYCFHLKAWEENNH